MLALGGAAIGALAALNSALATPPAAPQWSLPGEARTFEWGKGSIHYTVHGAGKPLLLLHGIGLTASSFEMRYVAEPLSRSFRVFIPDLLGFGRSDRPKIAYTSDLYLALITDFLAQVIGDESSIVAAGLSGHYAIEVAVARKELVRSLVISAPPPLGVKLQREGPTQRSADLVLGAPILGPTVYNLMTARNGIRAYLRERAYSNPDLVTESMVDAMYAMAHQPNAVYAPQAYLAGRLDTDSGPALRAIRQPLLVVFGVDAIPSPKDIAAGFVRQNPRTQVAILERCGSLPHEEQAERFATTVNAWLSS